VQDDTNGDMRKVASLASRLTGRDKQQQQPQPAVAASVASSYSPSAPPERPAAPMERLPTPDYQREDVRTPVVEAVASPLSPATSPGHDDPRRAKDLHAARSLPELSGPGPFTPQPPMSSVPGHAYALLDENMQTPRAVPRKGSLGAEEQQHPHAGYNHHPNRPNTSGSQTQGRFPPRAPHGYGQQPMPSRQWGPRGPPPQGFPPGPGYPQQQGTGPRPPRGIQPRGPSGPRAFLPGEYDDQTDPVARVSAPPPEDAQSFRLLDASVPPHEENPPSSPPAVDVPGKIYPAPPIGARHLDCLHAHDPLREVSNSPYPLACQTCRREDAEPRWLCWWCGVRVCHACQESLVEECARDVGELVRRVGGGGGLDAVAE
jgi:hypothetical protein